MKAREWLPPALLDLLRKVHRKGARDLVFETYREALHHCPADAYQSDLLAEVVFRKTRTLIETPEELAPSPDELNIIIGIAAASSSGNPVNVLDVGGACGTHYFYFKRFAPGYRVRWCVLETPAMTASSLW